jgi:hypothetical protein
MNRLYWLVGAGALVGSTFAMAAAPKGPSYHPAARPMPHPVARPAMMPQSRPQLAIPQQHMQPVGRPVAQPQFHAPVQPQVIHPQGQPNLRPSLNQITPQPRINPAIQNNVVGKPSNPVVQNNVVGKPSNPALNPNNVVGKSFNPGVVQNNLVGKPNTTLLTNPHPGVTNNLGRATGPKPAQTAAGRTSAAHHAVVAPQTAALAAASAINPNLTPATLALYAYSQRNASHPWWTPFGIPIGGYGYGGYGGFGYGGFGYGGYGYGHRWGAFASIGWAPYGFNPFWFGCGSPGFGIGFGYNSGPWSIGVGYGWGFGYAPAITYVPYVVEQPVIVADPGVPVLQSINPPLIPQATGPAPAPPAAVGPTLPPPAAVEKPQAEPEADFAARGQEQFLAGKYADAVKSLRHAVLDDPKNGPLLALTGEALWAAGNFNEAAGAFQQSLLATPEADWKAVAHRAARLTPADSVTALGNALVKEEQPSLRFLAAYQSFGAGKWEEATAHLDVVLKKAPDDQVAKKLRELAVKASEGK